jgi:ubiquinone/menaquinone biosynthesis C-methylase UbiE
MDGDERDMAHGHRRYRHDDEQRRRWQNPEAILAEIGLEPGMTFIDLGCGEGFFALPAARLVGEAGRVYALDINAEAIEHLKETAANEGLGNVTAMAGTGEESLLCEECGDIVFLGIVLHDFRDAAVVLRNARAMVKPTGRLINLDWKKEEMELGPPLGIRFDEAKASGLIAAAGFTIESVREMGPYHYLIEATPDPDYPPT